jgi:predicted RNase H-like HicB family nuclease
MYDLSHSAAEIEQETFIPKVMSSFTWPIKEFSVGSTAYVFLRPIQRQDIPSEDGWVSYIRELPKHIGKGQTAEEAFEDLKINIHADFQRLHRKRPFEMSEEESARWSNLASVIDVLEYKMTTPVVVREIGQVSYGMISRPQRIKWIRGENYFIDPTKVPGDLMGCVTGQWIEAVVKRDPINHRVLEIESVNKIRFRIPSESEIKSFWENMPEANLESDDWVW